MSHKPVYRAYVLEAIDKTLATIIISVLDTEGNELDNDSIDQLFALKLGEQPLEMGYKVIAWASCDAGVDKSFGDLPSPLGETKIHYPRPITFLEPEKYRENDYVEIRQRLFEALNTQLFGVLQETGCQEVLDHVRRFYYVNIKGYWHATYYDLYPQA